MFMRFASSGYTASTLLVVFRLISACPHARGVLVATHPPISSRLTANSRCSARIDTFLPVLFSNYLYSCTDHTSGYQKFFPCITLVSPQGHEQVIGSSGDRVVAPSGHPNSNAIRF